jgi:glycosyltransferase involved in cell wall biosynthesis
MRVALVHDWLIGIRGGEKVLECLAELYPQADIYTAVLDQKVLTPSLREHRIIPSFLQRLPAARRFHRHLLPLMPLAMESFDLRAYDLVISSSHCAAKGVLTGPNVLHVAYLHTPMRYAYEQFFDYFGDRGALRTLAFQTAFLPLRLWDELSSLRVDHFIANSQHVARRIRKYYRREAVVINPPVDIERFAPLPSSQVEDYYLVVSALVPYKRIDLAIETFRERPNGRLVIVGDGPLLGRLRSDAPPNVQFRGYQEGEALAGLYARARALIMPGEEDFGITPLEAQASGRPVVAYGYGGVTDSVRPLGQDDAPGGVFFSELSAVALSQALDQLEAHLDDFDPQTLQAHARTFSRALFKERVASVLQGWLAER